jgi:hypothetical protein
VLQNDAMAFGGGIGAAVKKFRRSQVICTEIFAAIGELNL